MLSCHNAIWCPKWSTKQNPQDLQCHGHNSSAHIAHQSRVITNACWVFILILCTIAGVLGIWHIVNQRYVLTFLMFLYISNLSYIHPGNSESLPFNGCIICFNLPPKVCAPTSSIWIVISLAQQLIIDHPTSPSPSTFPPSTFCCIFMYHMYILYLPKLILQEHCIVHRVHVYIRI